VNFLWNCACQHLQDDWILRLFETHLHDLLQISYLETKAFLIWSFADLSLLGSALPSYSGMWEVKRRRMRCPASLAVTHYDPDCQRRAMLQNQVWLQILYCPLTSSRLVCQSLE
jgi:hypothetical protein